MLISNRQDLDVDEPALSALAERTLLAEGKDSGELSISFVTQEEMAQLHRQYAGEPGTTDVLSFPLHEDGLLGDVIVSPEEAQRNNPNDSVGELRLLVVHGILHLLGYDHEEEEDRRVMWEKQETYAGVRSP
ncbi:MAG: rRNA maturation RNase YbeY [Actinomycetota bacterium]|nr:rRNA maturation RNase YbeY [Actinomycetota bacterium]